MKHRSLLALALIVAGCGSQQQPGAQGQAGDNAVEANAAATPAASAAAARSSRFTPLSDAACTLKETIEETGDWTRTCPGIARYTVEWSSGDLREDLALVRNGKSTDLGLPSKVANGAFDALGKQVEWRGPTGAAPDVLVVRVHVADQNGKNDSGRLAVVRLGPEPCLIAVVGPKQGQSEEARAVADRDPAPSCLKGDQ